MKACHWISALKAGELDSVFNRLYGAEAALDQRVRYSALLSLMHQTYPADDVFLFSSPGRTELGGNHTDHNGGKVIAASVDLDSVAAVSPCPENRITLVSEGYPRPFVVDLTDLAPVAEEAGSTQSLLRGIAACLRQKGHRIGGFRGFITSSVLPGSGLSSSASVEVLIATIFNHFYNGGTLPPLEIARIARYAENVYFGKPCGLMDQAACARGGIVALDFRDPENIDVKTLHCDFRARGYTLAVVNTGGTHADLTAAYALIPEEMKSLAGLLGKEVCREVPYELFEQNIPLLRERLGERALLRYLHFYTENKRVERQLDYLQKGNLSAYLAEVQASGSSSWRWLQNCYPSPDEQPLTLALGLTEHFLFENSQTGTGGACRVHGGGFAGTIQVYLPHSLLESYIRLIEGVWGQGVVIPLRIRRDGVLRLGEPLAPV